MRQISVSIYLPPTLHKLAKKAAKEQHCSLGTLVRQALQAYLDGAATATFNQVTEHITQIEKALDRVLAALLRLGDRVEEITTSTASDKEV